MLGLVLESLYTILSYLGSDYFIFMGVWSGGGGGGGGRRKIFHKKNQDQIFPEKNIYRTG